MKKLFGDMKNALIHGENVVLCTVIAKSGSAPRGAGAKMAVYADGTAVGTIGGGSVEYTSIQRAMEIHRSGNSFVEGFCLYPNDVADIGMVCGGNVTVHFQYFCSADPVHVELISTAVEKMECYEPFWLVTAIKGNHVEGIGLYEEANGIRFLAGVSAETLKNVCGRQAVLLEGDPALYVEPMGAVGRVLIFGGGHVSQALAPVLSHIDYAVIVCEDRPEFARKSLFPTAAATKLVDFSDVLSELSVTENDSFVIMTRGHQDDYLVLRQALQTNAHYIGVIGSRKKGALTFERLRGDGYTDRDLQRIHTPIGLKIGAETPAEIAISIAAELIQERDFLKLKSPIR